MTGARHAAARAARPWLRQLVSGLVALPLSALPFVAYVTYTPEGRLVRDRALVALRPPTLPTLDGAQLAAARSVAPRYTGQVMALAYHGIGSASDGDGGYVVSPSRFGEHLATLRAAGMRAVTAAQVADSFGGGSPLPANSVMISFDDGRTDAMMFADPLLAQARMVATMFVITGSAEKPGIYYASWGKLEDYSRSGRWDLQSHTATLHHDQRAAGGEELPALTSLAPGESLTDYRTRVREDLARASRAIERHTGRSPSAFAYPFGAYGADRTNHPGIRDVLRAEVNRRYAVAFHQDDQDTVPLAAPGDDRLGLRRLEVGDWSGLELLGHVRRAATMAAAPDTGAGTPPVDAPAAVPAAPPADGPGAAEAPGPVTTGTTVPGPSAGTVPARTPPRTPSAPPVGPSRRPPVAAPPPAPAGPAPTTSPGTAPPPPTTAPPPTSPPTTVTTRPPTTTTTTTRPPTTTTTTTRPPTTTTTTTAPPTTTTTDPRGCRSRGQGNVCSNQS